MADIELKLNQDRVLLRASRVIALANEYLAQQDKDTLETLKSGDLKDYIHFHTHGDHVHIEQNIDDADIAQQVLAELANIKPGLGQKIAGIIRAEQTGTLPSLKEEKTAQDPDLKWAERKMFGGEAEYLRKYFDIRVVGSQKANRSITLELPEAIESQHLDLYMKSFFPGTEYKPVQLDNDRTRVEISLYGLKDSVNKFKNPLTKRAGIKLDNAKTKQLEEEYRIATGIPLESQTKTVIPEGHEDCCAPIYEKAAEIQNAESFLFDQYRQHGSVNLEIRNTDSLIFHIAKNLSENGSISANDLQIHQHGEHTHLSLTPNGLQKLNLAVVKGITVIADGKDEFLGLMSPDSVRQRNLIRQGERETNSLIKMAEAALTDMSPQQREAVITAVDDKQSDSIVSVHAHDDHWLLEVHPQNKPQLKQLNKTIADAQNAGDVPKTNLDTNKIKQALDIGQITLDEDAYFERMEKRQVFSEKNTIRRDLKQAVSDLQNILDNNELSPQQLNWLVNKSDYKEPIRQLGNFMGHIHSESDHLGHNEAYKDAFGLTKMTLDVRDSVTKIAAYHIRNQQGQVGIGEKTLKAGLILTKPVVGMARLAVEKPVITGATVLGMVVAVAALPESPVEMIDGVVDQALEVIGLEHNHGGGEHIHEEARTLVEQSEFAAGFTAATVAFLAYNVVENVVIHVPLVIASVAVGATASFAGVKIAKPVVDEVMDIAARITPDPIKKRIGNIVGAISDSVTNPGSVIGRVTVPAKEFASDVKDLGMTAALIGMSEKASGNMTNLMERTLGKNEHARA